MIRQDVFNSVQNIFRDIFDQDDLIIENITNSHIHTLKN